MDALFHLVAFANDEVTFTGTVFQIIEIHSFHLAFANQVHGYDGLQAMPQVLTGKSILPLVHHRHIYGIDFFLYGALLALPGVFLHTDKHVGLFEIIDIVLGRMLGFEVEEVGQAGGDNDGWRHIQQMVGHLLEGGLVDNLEAFLDVPFQDVLYQRIDISLVVFDYQQFREKRDILQKNSVAECVILQKIGSLNTIFDYAPSSGLGLCVCLQRLAI